MTRILNIECQIEADGSVCLLVHGNGLDERDFVGGKCHDIVCATTLEEAARLLALRDYAQPSA